MYLSDAHRCVKYMNIPEPYCRLVTDPRNSCCKIPDCLFTAPYGLVTGLATIQPSQGSSHPTSIPATPGFGAKCLCECFCTLNCFRSCTLSCIFVPCTISAPLSFALFVLIPCTVYILVSYSVCVFAPCTVYIFTLHCVYSVYIVYPTVFMLLHLALYVFAMHYTCHGTLYYRCPCTLHCLIYVLHPHKHMLYMILHHKRQVLAL